MHKPRSRNEQLPYISLNYERPKSRINRREHKHKNHVNQKNPNFLKEDSLCIQTLKYKSFPTHVFGLFRYTKLALSP